MERRQRARGVVLIVLLLVAVLGFVVAAALLSFMIGSEGSLLV